MRGKFVDETSSTFGFLRVLRRTEPPKTVKRKVVYWLCECKLCGAEKPVAAQDLRTGKMRSCGCLKKLRWTKHGMSRSVFNRTAGDIKSRCYNKKDVSYETYGGRGIRVWEPFKDRSLLINYLMILAKATLPNDKIQKLLDEGSLATDLFIDRIDNNSHYQPGNLRWATRKEQQNNQGHGEVGPVAGPPNLGVVLR